MVIHSCVLFLTSFVLLSIFSLTFLLYVVVYLPRNMFLCYKICVWGKKLVSQVCMLILAISLMSLPCWFENVSLAIVPIFKNHIWMPTS